MSKRTKQNIESAFKSLCLAFVLTSMGAVLAIARSPGEPRMATSYKLSKPWTICYESFNDCGIPRDQSIPSVLAKLQHTREFHRASFSVRYHAPSDSMVLMVKK